MICLLILKFKNGGETGIRTQERVAPLPVFKTGAFDRSAISPVNVLYLLSPNDAIKIYFHTFLISIKHWASLAFRLMNSTILKSMSLFEK